MAQDLRRLHALIQGLVRRERSLLLLQVTGQAWLLLCALLVLALAVPSLSVEREAGTALLVAVAGIGSWALVWVPLLLRWRRAGDPLRQARLVERITPDLRGRLVSAVDPALDVEQAASQPLMGLMVRRALTATEQLDRSRVHSATLALAVVALAMVATVVPPVVGALLPGGLAATSGWWLGGGEASDAVSRALGAGGGPTARLGDLTLTYTYPEYTGLEPREVPNSTGEVYGPPGTRVQVTARSARPIEAAALVAYDDPALDAQVTGDGRQLTGQFNIGTEEGTYHLVTYESGAATPSPDYPIRPEADLAPTLVLDADGDVVEVAVDEGLPVYWLASDDYGLSRVVLEVDGQHARRLAEPLERRAELSGDLMLIRPLDLGLAPGDSVELTVAAWDNDEVSGEKRGVSRALEVVVVGSSGASPKADKLAGELRDVLVDALAGFLVEDFPPGTTDGDISRWGERVYDRYGEFDELATQNLGRVRNPVLERVMAMVQESAGELVRFTQVGFVPGGREPAAPPALLDLEGLRDTAMLDLEDGILLLDRFLRSRAMEEMLDDAKALAQVSDDLRYQLQDELDPQGILSKLEQIERFEKALQDNAAKLPQDDRIAQFVQRRAVELDFLVQEGREAMAKSDPERARTMLERMTERARELSEGIEDRLAQREQQEQEGEDKVKQLIEELEALEEEQRELQNAVNQLRQELDASSTEQAEQAFTELDRLTRELVADGQRWLVEHPESDVPLHVRMAGEDAVDRSARLLRAVAARDIEGAREAADWAQLSWVSVQRRSSDGRDAAELADDAATIAEKLDELMAQQPQGSTQARSAGQELSQQQQGLEQRLQAARQLGQEVVQDMSIQPRGLDEGLEQAGEQMGRADQTLQQGRLMPAEGSQGASAQSIREAREALEEALEQQQQSGNPSEGGGGTGQEGEDSQGGKEGPDQQMRPMRIPPPEDFQTPEDYREALLKGMQGDVPEEYRALKKRYYEELVRQ